MIGTVTDVEYTGAYFAQQSPALMSYVAALNGYVSPPIDQPFRYFEIGCGKGITSIALAAAYPDCEFHACDINPAHVATAERIARDAGVANVHFMAAGISDLLSLDPESYDFVSLHGFWSWVPPEVRRDVLAFLQARLAPGGLAMVSYNALPGWAAIEPVRRMMFEYAKRIEGNSIEKARRALDYVRFLVEQKAAYFAAHPSAAEFPASLQGKDLRYLAHEFMTPFSTPFYFEDVAAEFSKPGLSFAGNLAVPLNYPAEVVPEAFAPLMRSAPSRRVLEMHRDFVLNTRFRNDLYSRQPERPHAAASGSASFRGLGFRLAAPPDQLPLQGMREMISYDFRSSAGAVARVHELLLRQGAADVPRLGDAAGLPGEQASLFVQRLVLAGHLAPCRLARQVPIAVKAREALLRFALEEGHGYSTVPAPGTGSVEFLDVTFALAMSGSGDGQVSIHAQRVIDALAKVGRSPAIPTSGGGMRTLDRDAALQFVGGLVRRAASPSASPNPYLRSIGAL